MDTETSGDLTLITGCMWAGKTTELLRHINRYKVAGLTVLLIKPSKDTRSGHYIATHPNPEGQRVFSDAIEIKQFSEIEIDLIRPVHVIGIDEGNFFGQDIVGFCDHWANHGKKVIVSALNATAKCDHFGSFHLLYPLMDYHIHLTAICMMCKKNNASRTFKKTGSNAELEVGGAELYDALCRHCYNVAEKRTLTLE